MKLFAPVFSSSASRLRLSTSRLKLMLSLWQQLLLYPLLLLLLYSSSILIVIGLTAADSDARPAIDEFFHMVEEYVEHVPPHMTICMFGLVPFHEMLAHQIFARLQPPKYEHWVLIPM